MIVMPCSLVEAHDHVLDLLDDVGLNSLSWFVEQDNLRVGQHRAGNGELLLLTAGQIAAAAIQNSFSTGNRSNTLSSSAPASPGLRRAKMPSFRFSRTVNRGRMPRALRHIADAVPDPIMGRGRRNFLAVEPDAADVLVHQPDDAAQQRGLADAVASEHAEEAAVSQPPASRSARRGYCHRRR